MESIKELIFHLGFNRYSFVVLIVTGIIGVIILGRIAKIESNEQRFFSCRIKGDEKDYAQGLCFKDYQAKTTRGFPIYGFVLLKFLFILLVCICYSQSVKSIIQYLESTDLETQIVDRSSRCLYRRYCIQLAVRLAWGFLFLVLQWGAFYPINFPSEYVCDLSQFYSNTHVNSTGSTRNVTQLSYHCLHPEASKKTTWSISVFAVNLILTVLNLVELMHILYKGKTNDNFKKDKEFLELYLLSKLHNKIVEDYVAKIKCDIKKDTNIYEPLYPNFPGEEKNTLKFDKIYTNLVIFPGRAKPEFKGERHEIFEGYLNSQQQHESINKLEDIFAPKEDDPNDMPNNNIMIIGRPGIGKSLLCQKILRDWASGTILSKETEVGTSFELVYLFKFRYFNNVTENLNLEQLLGRSRNLPKEVFDYIIQNPENVLFIFDGLDEFENNLENITNEELYSNSHVETMPFSALYVKLLKGKLLERATIVTTSRPTALSYVSRIKFDRSLEILGFNFKQIQKYVEQFCQDANKCKMIWNPISTNANLLSLCYVPVNCHIVCVFLQEKLKRGNESMDYLRTRFTLTEIYEDTLRCFVCKHNPEYRNNEPEQEKLLNSDTLAFVPGVERSLKCLGAIAYKGIEERRLIFESDEVKDHEEIGLLHRLPNEKVPGTMRSKPQYCFLHLTLQEFLAAWYKVKLNEGNLKDLQTWISDHICQGKWEVVVQFVAGLLHDDEDNSTIKFFIERLPRPVSRQTKWPSRGDRTLVLRLFYCLFEISNNSKNEWKKQITRQLQGIVDVDFNHSSITDADLTSIVFILQEVENVKSLDLSWNYIGPTGCLEICNLLKVFENSDEQTTNKCKPTTLNISVNPIGDGGLKHLSDALSTNECKLTTLNIRLVQISDGGLKHLSDALSTNECKLTTLKISLVQIGDGGLKHLSDALSTNECKLTTLDISRNQIGDGGLKHLSDALFTNECKLTTLDISGNQIGDGGLKHLSDALTTNECKLTTLNISVNQIGDGGLKHLSDALSTNECKLTTLNIRGNQISDGGLKHLSDALSTNECKLTTLNISGNQIGDGGLKHLSDALSTNECKLTTLDISENQIGDGGLKHLSDALSTNECKLTTLDISENQIGDGGLKHLSDALTTNECKLTTLEIVGDQIGDEGLKHLSETLCANGCKLTTLNIFGTKISEDGLKHFYDALTQIGLQPDDNLLSLRFILRMISSLR